MKVSDVVHSIRTVPKKASYTILVVARHFGSVTIIVPTCKNNNPVYLRRKRVAYVICHPSASLTASGLDFLRLVSSTKSDWDGLAGKEAKSRKRCRTDSPENGRKSPPSGDVVTLATPSRSSPPAAYLIHQMQAVIPAFISHSLACFVSCIVHPHVLFAYKTAHVYFSFPYTYISGLPMPVLVTHNIHGPTRPTTCVIGLRYFGYLL